MNKNNFLKFNKKIAIFFLTIIIVSISLVLISILFSSVIVNKDTNSQTTPTTFVLVSKITPTTSTTIKITSAFANIKTISGKQFDESKLPKHYSANINIEASSKSSGVILISQCASAISNNIKVTPLPANYKDQLKKALESIDVSYENNTFEPGIDSTC